MTPQYILVEAPDGGHVGAAYGVDADGSLNPIDPNALAQEQRGSCTYLINGNNVRMASLPLGKGAEAQIHAAARALLMQQHVTISDDDVVCVGPKSPNEDARWCGVVRQSALDSYVHDIETLGHAVHNIIPLPLLLPTAQNGFNILCDITPELRLVRTDDQAAAGEPSLLSFVFDDVDSFERIPLSSVLSQRHLGTQTPLNLLQQQSKAGMSKAGWTNWLKGAAAALILCLVLWPSLSWIEIIKNNRAIQTLEAETLEMVKQALPDAPRIVNARAQLREAMASRGLANASARNLLANLTTAVTQTPAISLDRVRFESGQVLEARLSVDSQVRLDQLSQALRSNGLTVTSDGVRSTRDGPRAEIKVSAQ